MRRLGHFRNVDDARRFAVALKNRGIRADFRSTEDGVAIWVLDEDKLDAARQELAAFEADPNAERFHAPARDDEPRPSDAPTIVVAREPARPVWRRVLVTSFLIAASVAAFVATQGGEGRTAAARALSIASYDVQGGLISWDGLADIRSGQVWRAVTPIFLHFGPLHLLFNMMWLWMLGGAIESLRGSARLAALVVVSAVASNLAEYWFNFGFDFAPGRGFQADFGRRPSPAFGGMSGVAFALFGFVWMRSRLLRGSGFAMPRDTVVWMLIWLLVCTAGFVGPIANVAHGVGLLAGMTLGAAPRLWRRGEGPGERDLPV